MSCSSDLLFKKTVTIPTITEHLIVTILPWTGIQNAKLEVNRAFLFFKQ
jgi:hypothetical protein